MVEEVQGQTERGSSHSTLKDKLGGLRQVPYLRLSDFLFCFHSVCLQKEVAFS